MVYGLERGYDWRGTAAGVAHTVAAHVGVRLSAAKMAEQAATVAEVLESRAIVGPPGGSGWWLRRRPRLAVPPPAAAVAAASLLNAPLGGARGPTSRCARPLAGSRPWVGVAGAVRRRQYLWRHARRSP